MYVYVNPPPAVPAIAERPPLRTVSVACGPAEAVSGPATFFVAVNVPEPPPLALTAPTCVALRVYE